MVNEGLDHGWIEVRGARTHNLKDITVQLPRGKFVVISGVSGSGKSSLAFDTLYAEGQRRYVESLSSYARQFIGQMKKADCDGIEGLSPAISIDQKQGSHNPRSTVATVTEIQDYFRLLWARIGKPHCPTCGREVARRTVQEIVDDIIWNTEGHAIILWAPAVRARKGTHADLFRQLVEQGYLHGKVNGHEVGFEKPPELDKNFRHDIDVRVDRLRCTKDRRQRLTESVEGALKLGGGTVAIESMEAPAEGEKLSEGTRSHFTKVGETVAWSEDFACPDHGAFMPELSPRVFSFNSPLGACSVCQGLGVERQFNVELIIDGTLTVSNGCVRPWRQSMSPSWYRRLLEQVSQHYGISRNTPFELLDDDDKDILLNGSGSTIINFHFESDNGSVYKMNRPWEGIIARLQKTYTETTSERTRSRLISCMTDLDCSECGGEKLNAAARYVSVGGIRLPEVSRCSVHDSLALIRAWQPNGEGAPENFADVLEVLDERSLFIGKDILKEIENRLGFLDSVGLDYLTLDRKANTLSGGESQRIRLATQIGSRLTGVMYVLDEPSIGLHQRDNARLLATLRELSDLGNTLIVVEHDEDTLRQADWLCDLGPGAGLEGGMVVANGPPEVAMKAKDSVTGAFLSGRRSIATPEERRKPSKKWISIKGAQHNNLQSIHAKIPIGCMTAVTGVSGSGKSSLVSGILAPALQRHLHNADTIAGKHTSMKGLEHVDKAIIIDQSPIGRTPRSNPATYTKVFDEIRILFSKTTLAKERGYTPGHFSFNVKGGRCESCKGAGSIKLEMNFLPDVWITCDVCQGLRYTRECLEVTWKGKNINDILQMPIGEAVTFFENHRKIFRTLDTLRAVGLSYVRLGQPATTLSGGEAQRVKLASELRRPPNKHTVYILDEPTTGLSFSDVELLINVLLELRAKGHSVIVIEHHLDVIKSADWVIDLGPEGGERGGMILAQGTPEDVAANPESFTGQYLAKLLS
ncbi:MAG: excinuclease ABC subunit UvrA [Candidatus Poseidoniaceae archaeon]|jgi:excinuclease ABC subunit A|tara:strand:- start:213 stop:3152 length:2940 start_codon:yes stop_codon:yes gene_type:complete